MPLVCWKCGANISGAPKPMPRLERCKQCEAELHVCRLCRFYNAAISDGCDEPLAASSSPADKARANFCDYFQIKADAWVVTDTGAADKARSELDALFGGGESSGSPSNADEARSELDALFGNDDKG